MVVVPHPSTTTGAESTTSTSSPVTTTAPTAPSSSGGSSNSWIWIVVAVAVVGAAIVAYVLWRRHRARAAAAAAWRAALEKTYLDVQATRDVLHTTAAAPIDDARLETLRHESETVGAALANLTTTAPDDESRTRTENAGNALRSYMLAIETEQLLHHQAATEDALADANVARRTRATELDQALDALDQLIKPPAT